MSQSPETIFGKLIETPFAVVFLIAQWSPSCRIAQSIFVKWQSGWKNYNSGIPCNLFEIDQDQQPFSAWIQAESQRLNTELIMQGQGTILWISAGRILDFIHNPIDVGLLQISRKTIKLYKEHFQK